MSVLAPNARERRTLWIGAAVVAVALFATAVVRPTVRRWRDREAMIDALQAQRARLIALTEQREALEGALAARQATAAALPVRLLQARTPALAASAVQELLQGHAAASRLSVTRLDVAAAPDTASTGAPALPATLAAVGDIYGLADFLRRVEQGSTWLEVREVAVAPNPSLRGELLQLSVTVRAPFVVSP